MYLFFFFFFLENNHIRRSEARASSRRSARDPLIQTKLEGHSMEFILEEDQKANQALVPKFGDYVCYNTT